MSGISYTADEITESIIRALGDRQVEAVPPLLRLLAVKDPIRAREVLDTINAGMAIAERGQQ